MVATSQLNTLQNLVALLGPSKEATEEVSGANYVTSSLAIPIINLILQTTEQATPSITFELSVIEGLLKRVEDQLSPLERNIYLSAATILDPRFKRIHF